MVGVHLNTIKAHNSLRVRQPLTYLFTFNQLILTYTIKLHPDLHRISIYQL